MEQRDRFTRHDLFVLLRAHVERRHRRLALALVLGIAAAVLLIGGLAEVAQQGGETVRWFGRAPSTEDDDTDHAGHHQRAGSVFGAGVALVEHPGGEGERDHQLDLSERAHLGGVLQGDGHRPAG